MEKKSVAASILVIFLALLFSVIGICFSTFVYKDTKIIVQKVSLSSASGIDIFKDEKLEQKATELKLSDMELGLKPATGELDEESQIPSTINDQGTSEGYYSTVYIKTTKNFKINIKNVKIETKKDQTSANEQKKNIYVAIKDRINTTKTLEKEVTELATFENVTETLKLTFYVWLGSIATDDLEGAKISFTLDFQVL